MTEESRRKMSLKRLGKPRPGNPENWKHSEETKKKLSVIHKAKGLGANGTSFKKGHTPWSKGLNSPYVPWNKGKKGEYKLWPNGRVVSEETKRKLREAGRDRKHSEETKKKMSLSHRGHPVSEETRKKIGLKNSLNMKGKRNSPQTEFKKGQVSINKGKECPWARNNPQVFAKGIMPWNFRKSVPQYSGEKHWNWKGGVSEEYMKIRQSVEYKIWRDSVFKRDSYTCVWCGDDRGGNLEADHIKPFAFFPDLRLSLDNGRTLCIDCHKKTDTWGEKAKRFAPRASIVAV